MNLDRFRLVAAPIAASLLLLLDGCATSAPSTSPSRPDRGLAEFADLVQDSKTTVLSALTSIDTLNAQAPSPSTAAVSAFSEEVDRMAAASFRVRARYEAMQARGDAYFQSWQQNVASIDDPDIRALAQRHRAELQQSFGVIKVSLQGVRESFQSFLTGLRTLRIMLEKNSTQLSAASAQNLVRNTRDDGRRVQDGLEAVAVELRHMAAMLVPPGPTAKE